MNRLSKFMIAGLAVAAMTGTALAQDAEPDPSDDPAADPTTDDPAADPATEPAAEPAMEEPAGGKSKTIGADVAFLFPLGDFADAVDAAFGALGRFEFGLNPALSITGRAGLLYALSKLDGVTLLMIPVYGGVKYNIGTSGLFAHGEVGIVHSRISFDGGSDSNTKISFDAGAGYQMGKLQFRAGFWYTATDPASMGLLASAGFDFVSM
jgi:hypothetical protein